MSKNLFRNEPKASPERDPIGRAMMARGENTGKSKELTERLITFNRNADRTPQAMPDRVPLMVFPSPRILLPRHERPRSKGVPPPKTAAALLGI